MKNKEDHIALGLFVLFAILPFFASLIYAFLYSVGLVGIANTGFTFDFWQKVLTNGEFVTSFGFSFLIAAISTFISVSGALLITFKFREELEKTSFGFLMYLPLAIPGIVTSFITFQVMSKGGFISRLAYNSGVISDLGQFPELVNDSLAIGIILSYITMTLPFFVLTFINIHRNERVEELSSLAVSLGATPPQVTRRIFIPLLLQRARVLIILAFIVTMGGYEVPLILGRQSPQMLSVLIIRELKQYDLTKISQGYVEAVIYTMLVALTVILLFRTKKASYA